MLPQWRRVVLGLVLALAVSMGARAEDAHPARLAVLEFELAPGAKIDRVYFSDLARAAVHRKVPSLFVMTRETTEALLTADGKKLSDCQGACEIEMGRKLGADYIISGRIAQIGSWTTLALRLFSTADGQLVETAEARAKTEDELLDKTDQALGALTATLGSHSGQKAADEKAEQKAAEAKAAEARAAEQKALDAKAAEQKVAEQKLADEKAAAQRAADEKAAAQRAADEKAAQDKAAQKATDDAQKGALVTDNAQAKSPSAPAEAVQAPAEAVQAPALPAAAPSHTRAYVMLGAAAALAGGSIAFDNLSSTSKDGKLGAVDFVPVAGYAIALGLGAYAIYTLVTP
ncbi:MAG: hypothetical protein JST92_21095 [Deltaproteobacteria bacterium]|nr:hypothetical protein [Deltaproteobacteria bacterium]